MLNERAREILRFIQRYRHEHGSAPTIREIGRQFEISSTNGVRYHLNLLEKAGYIRRTGGISRGIGSTEESSTGIPVLGRVAAGEPITTELTYDGTLQVHEMFGKSDQLFALKVRGDSMVDAGIVEGDYVIVQKQDTAQPGDLVVASVENEATVKYYKPRKDTVELVPANDNYQPMVMDGSVEFHIMGLVRGVIRTVGRS
jgi:repressor LexA